MGKIKAAAAAAVAVATAAEDAAVEDAAGTAVEDAAEAEGEEPNEDTKVLVCYFRVRTPLLRVCVVGEDVFSVRFAFHHHPVVIRDFVHQRTHRRFRVVRH